MPIQDDIDDANLSRIEREAQRQKKAAQQATTVQYLGMDGATGQVRVISGSGAAPVRVANHSNTQARPGDIKRGFAGGFDRGNRSKSKIFIPRIKTTAGNLRILCLSRNGELRVGGHVSEPLPTGIFIPQNAANLEVYIENLGSEDSDHLVAYSYLVGANKTIGVYNGLTQQSWSIPNAPQQLTYKRGGVFLSEATMPDLIPTYSNSGASRTTDSTSVIGLLYPTYLGSGSGTRRIIIDEGSGYVGTLPQGVTVAINEYYIKYDFSTSSIIFYGLQTSSRDVIRFRHSSSGTAYRASSSNLETIQNTQSYSRDFSANNGNSVCDGDAFWYDDSVYRQSSEVEAKNGNYPCPVGISDQKTGVLQYDYSINIPTVSFQHLLQIPAPASSITNVDPDYYVPLPDGWPPGSEQFSATEKRYSPGIVFRGNYYYLEKTINYSSPSDTTQEIKLFLSMGGLKEVDNRLYNTPVVTINQMDFVEFYDDTEAFFYPLETVLGKLSFATNPTYNGEVTRLDIPPEYTELSDRALITQRIILAPA